MTRKVRTIGEGGKPREVVAQSQNQEAEKNWTDLLYKRSWALLCQVLCSGGEFELSDTRTRSSTEEQGELYLNLFILQVRGEGSATADKLLMISELALILKLLSPQL